MLETRTYRVPEICRNGNESTFQQNIGTFFNVIIHFIRSRIKRADLIVGNMANNDEAGGSGNPEDVYEEAHAFFDYLDARRSSQDPLVTAEGGSLADQDIDNDTTGTDTGADTSNDAGELDGKQPESKRVRRPNQLGIGRLVVTAVHPGTFEPSEPKEARSCYGNQIGCILRETASINDEALRKVPNMEHFLLTKLHRRFLFPGRDDSKEPWLDKAMKKIKNKAMGKFSNALSAWKVRVK